MKKFQATFGIYAVTVDAENETQAIKAIEKKIDTYSKGGTKGDGIRSYLERMPDIKPFQVYFKNGFYREV